MASSRLSLFSGIPSCIRIVYRFTKGYTSRASLTDSDGAELSPMFSMRSLSEINNWAEMNSFQLEKHGV